MAILTLKQAADHLGYSERHMRTLARKLPFYQSGKKGGFGFAPKT